MANQSDALRDRLADVLLEFIQPSVDEDGNKVPPDPRILAVARAFVKDNPPEEIPVPGSPAGVLKDKVGEMPFPVTEGNA